VKILDVSISLEFYRACTGLADYNTAQLVIFHYILQVTQAVTPAFSESLALFGLIFPRDRESLRAGEDLTFSDSRYSKHFLTKNFPFSTHILADPLSPIRTTRTVQAL